MIQYHPTNFQWKPKALLGRGRCWELNAGISGAALGAEEGSAVVSGVASGAAEMLGSPMDL